MFINDVNKKDEIRNIATQRLRKYGIKYRPKKPRPPGQQGPRYGKKFFKVPLQNLETETVTLSNGQQLVIPKRIHEMCSFILTKVQTEGIFRKEGSKSRQNEIKLSLDRGCLLGDDHHVIDVAVMLKCFLRELPEPLIPYSHHELFLRCSIIENKLDAVLLACLLLPSEHLNVLSYLMQFFYDVASFSNCNKMSFTNLSILLGPNLFPVDEKAVPKTPLMVTKICDLTRLLIENGRSVGVIPDYIIDQISHSNDVDLEKKRKKRRSGSLTRMFNGLKKIVSVKVEEETSYPQPMTPDLLLTPLVNNSVRKRKADNGLSAKKKKELITKLPDCALLNTPFTPSRTPISTDPNGKKVTNQEAVQDVQKEKKLHWYMRSRSAKNLKNNNENNIATQRGSVGAKSLLERRWSAVSSATNFRKKRSSCAATKKELEAVESQQPPKVEPDYVRVPKTEYEDIRNRVSAIEKRISLELDNFQSQNDDKNSKLDNIQNVQTAYEQTLDQIEQLSPTTDQLAKRLSRDLKIRRSAEQKIIRSPSARKIGTIRRRSVEREKRNSNLVRHQSWHVGTVETTSTAPLLPRLSIRKKKNNTKENVGEKVDPEPAIVACPTPFPNRMSSYHIDTSPISQVHSSPLSQISDIQPSYPSTSFDSASCSDHWTSAEEYFGVPDTPQGDSLNTRASIAKLRSQNVGMVRAKAKLFDNIVDSDNSVGSNRSSKSRPGSGKKISIRTGYKIGMVRSTEARMSYRVRFLRTEEMKAKKSISPRRRNVNISQRRLQQIGKQYYRINRDNSQESNQNAKEMTTPHRGLVGIESCSPRETPQNVPHIKVPLAVKTPKRLYRTPILKDKKTPLRVLATPN